MPTFAFRARDAAGRPQVGTLDAPSATVVAATLRGRGWIVLDVKAPEPADEGAGWLGRINPLYWLPPRSVDVEVSLQQIAVMLRSGLTLLTALNTVAEQTTRPSMGRVWLEVARRIQEGSSLAEAMQPHRCFPHLVVQLVRVGEQTGTLEAVIARAADAMERKRNLLFALLTALTYPTVVLFAAFGAAAFMVVNVIPKLGRFLTSLGRKLPRMTQMLVDIALWVETYGIYVLIGIVVSILAFVAVYLWPPGRLFVDRALLRVPVIGRLLRQANTALFARALGVLIHSGITLVEALRTVEDLHRNRYVARQVAQARSVVLAGGRLADPLGERRVFMPMLASMVAVGEASGTLDSVLDEVARFHEMQLQNAIRRLSVLAELLIILVVGAVVGFVYISFFVALFSAAGGVK